MCVVLAQVLALVFGGTKISKKKKNKSISFRTSFYNLLLPAIFICRKRLNQEQNPPNFVLPSSYLPANSLALTRYPMRLPLSNQSCPRPSPKPLRLRYALGMADPDCL